MFDNIWDTAKFFADHPQARIAEGDQQSAALRDAGYPEAEFYIDEMGIGHIYMPLISSKVVEK